MAIDTAVFFVKLEIEELVKTKFNPGGLVEMYESAESGISPLMVIPRTTQEIEEEIRREEAEYESQGTINQSEALQMKKNRPKSALQETSRTFVRITLAFISDGKHRNI